LLKQATINITLFSCLSYFGLFYSQ